MVGVFTRCKSARGIAPERFQLQWISASDGKEFAAKIREMDDAVDEYLASREEVGPDE